MNERRGESLRVCVCANELLPRNEIMQKIASWRHIAESLRLPEADPVSELTGYGLSTSPADVVEMNSPRSASLILGITQESFPSAATPPEGSVAEIVNAPPRRNYLLNNSYSIVRLGIPKMPNRAGVDIGVLTGARVALFFFFVSIWFLIILTYLVFTRALC